MLSRLRCTRFVGMTLMLLATAAALPAQDKDLPPLYQGYARSSLLYGELTLNGGLAPLLAFDDWVKAGAVGIAFEDLAIMMNQQEYGMDGGQLRGFVGGMRKISGGLMDVTIGGRGGASASYLFVIDHANPQLLLDLLTESDRKKSIVFRESGKILGSTTYRIQVPESWLDDNALAALFGMGRRRNPWGNRANVEVSELADPIYLSVWNNRYVILGARESDVKDAVEQYEFGEEEFALSSSRPFRESIEASKGADVFFYWNIATTINAVERFTGAEGRNLGGEVATIIQILEFKQFSHLFANARLDGDTGSGSFDIQVRYFNAPSWVKVVPFGVTPQPHTDFSPPAPATFINLNVGDPVETKQKILDLIRTKAEAFGSSEEMEQGLREFFEEFTNEFGFQFDELVGLLGSDHSFILTSPSGVGTDTKASGVFVLGLKDGAAVNEMIRTKFNDTNDPKLREIFVHTKERVYLDFEDGKRVSYTTFNSLDPEAAAWAIIGNVMVVGNQRGVRLSLSAWATGKNLTNDPRYTSIKDRVGANALMFSYGDSGSLGTIALNEARRSLAGLPTIPEVIAKPQGHFHFAVEEEEVWYGVLRDYFADLRSIGDLSVDERGISATSVYVGLPNSAQITEIAVRVINYYARASARSQLANELAPAVMNHVFETGDLPTSVEAFAAAGGDLLAFRDPSLAGASVTQPVEEQRFVWLGNHAGRPLFPALPLAHTRLPDPTGHHALLMSDGSVVRVTKPLLDEVVAKGLREDGSPFFRSDLPQTLDDALENLANTISSQGSLGFTRTEEDW